jgi:hypothetical protein
MTHEPSGSCKRSSDSPALHASVKALADRNGVSSHKLLLQVAAAEVAEQGGVAAWPGCPVCAGRAAIFCVSMWNALAADWLNRAARAFVPPITRVRIRVNGPAQGACPHRARAGPLRICYNQLRWSLSAKRRIAAHPRREQSSRFHFLSSDGNGSGPGFARVAFTCEPRAPQRLQVVRPNAP